MPQRLPNSRRTFRKRAYGTRGEVACLRGGPSGTRVSRYEQFRREPGLDTALAYGIIFAASNEELFAGLYERIEEGVLERAGRLVARIEARRLDPVARQKLASLRAISERNR